MAVAMRTNGLHHAVSLGTIEVSSKSAYTTSHLDRSYDSEDENMSRRRLKHTSSTELYPKPSVYSKGDIREQYCLTDRQLNTIERPRGRDRLFGCLSRRSTQQSFLGVCVGRRAPSDENLAADAPFYRYPRYRHQSPDYDLETSYFRRQPASILSTSKMVNESSNASVSSEGRYNWSGGRKVDATNGFAATDQSSFHCPSYAGINAGQQQQQQQQQHPPQSGPTTPRTKHVSFARSHTLTSFDDVNLGLRSSGRCKAVSRSQERLIGGKKPMMTSSAAQTMGETAIIQTPVAMTPSQYQTVPGAASMAASMQGNVAANMNLNLSQNALHSHSHMHPAQQHAHMHGHHGHSHHHGPQSITHIHQFVPGPAGVPGHLHVQTEQPLSSLAGHALLDDYGSIVGMSMNPPSPEVVVVEKKFRNAMKTQATQTDVRKEKGPGHFGSLSPHGIHKVTLVSQGAQTNGLLNGKKLAKSLSEMNNENILMSERYGERPDYIKLRKMDHEAVHRTQSEEPPRSPLDHCSFDAAYMDSESNINYYKPPPPLGSSSSNMMARCHAQRYAVPGGPQYQHAYYPQDEAPSRMVHSSMESNITTTESHRSDGFYPPNGYDFESNSLPRRACSHHRTEAEFTSNSLPRRDQMHQQDICKHITECSELLAGEPLSLDLNRMPLLPPPRQYCKEADYEDGNNANEQMQFDEENDLEEEEEEDEEEDEEEEEALPKVPPIDYPDNDRRRMSMVAMQHAPKRDDEDYTPFRRDDYRRQSMPVYVKQEKLIDGPVMARSSLRLKGRYNAAMAAASEEKEIFIDFKPHISAMKFSPNKKPQKLYKTTSVGEILAKLHAETKKVNEYENVPPPPTTESDMDCEEDSAREDPLYENIQGCMCKLSEERQSRDKAMDSFRKRSVSLDSGEQEVKPMSGVSAPPSPGRDDILANASTYPSSDSLANDVTRDHSDGIWNESQVTILTAEQRDISDSSYNSNLHLLTPTTRRKHLILQHQQQRSSIDTDALDLEEQFTDHSPTYSNTSVGKKIISTPTHQQQTTGASAKPTTTLVAPSIAVTPSSSAPDSILLPAYNAAKSPNAARRKSNAELRATERDFPAQLQQKNVETLNYARIEAARFANADVSECSTNTEEYATCTDTSKRTPGIKTPPTITSSSSTTQVPVSTQSSQITDKTHGGSSFESASSLYSTKGELLPEDLVPQPQAEAKFEQKSLMKDTLRGSPSDVGDLAKTSPAHSLSSVSSGSFNVGAKDAAEKSKDSAIAGKQTTAHLQGKQPGEAIAKIAPKERPKIKPESVSDDERSELRYSSSGYYESPHDEDEITKVRRFKMEEERNNRRRSSMKLDIERENIRALTSPIKKALPPPSATSATTATPMTTLPKSPEASKPYGKGEIMSPSRIKRFRPKIRRQFRKQSRDESTPRRTPKKTPGIYTPAGESTEKLLDLTLKPDHDPDDIDDHEVMEHEDLAMHKADHLCEDVKLTESATSPSSAVIKSSTDTFQLKAKSIESLRSVSPGSDSVFYSEAGADQHSHCLHCGKEMESQDSVVSGGVLGGDSVESLPCIENESGEHDIVKPPSDFADSPVTTKTTQRLYKKMDKRFRSEERYHHGDRGRLYKTRQENIRAKSEERSRDSSSRSPQMLRPAGSSPCVLPDIASSEQNQHTVYRGNYDAGRYTRLTDADVWTQLDHQSFDRQRERRASTDSERSFHTKYQVILHRLVQRRCTLEMYHRQKNNKFRVDKTIVVKSDSGEFGFRIHGSKPVVVAAIEPDTPAESSGLEVGDIIISVNGVQVLDKHHTEVVKIAHDGCEKLELQVARTIGVLMSEQRETPSQPIYSGFLWRQSGQAKGTPNSKKWVRRWFCLRPDNCLYYYKTENDNQPVGAMIMAKHTVEQCPPEIGKPFAFKIDSGEGIPMYVAADSDELANRWMKILKQSANQDNTWLDKCARNLYQQPSSIVRPDCFGYLMKLGSRWCGWSKRYCVLKDACLYFYQDANSKAAFGLACLHGYKVASMSTNAAGRKNSFEIIPPDGKLRHYYFSTESEMDKKRWISALEYSIDRWIKSG